MYNRFMFQSQYWQQTSWTWIYARQTAALSKIFQICRRCQSLTPLEARRPHKYCWFGEITLEGKLQSHRAAERERRQLSCDRRCLDYYMRSWRLWQEWPWWSWPWWRGLPQYWARSQSAVPPARRRSWAAVPPSRPAAARCWGSQAAAAAWPAPWREGRPVGFTRLTVDRACAARPGPVRPDPSTLWPGDRASALRTLAKVITFFTVSAW